MEKIYFENVLTDETGSISTLCYTVFPEQADRDFSEEYSLLVEKRTPHSSETAVIHHIGSKDEVSALAERLCKNTVTPVTLNDAVEDYITEKALV